MKTKLFLVGFLLLNMLAFAYIANIKAADYEMGVEEDDEIVNTIKSFDEDLADDTFGSDDIEECLGDGAEVGAKEKMVITDIDEGDVTWYVFGSPVGTWDSFIIEYEYWEWTTDDFDEDPDEDEEFTACPKDPSDIAEDWLFPFTLVPTPVADYLEEIEWHKDVDVDGTKVTVGFDEEDLKLIYPDAGGDAILVFTYNNKGILSNMKALNEDEEIIFEIALQGLIPGYELPILLGILGTMTIGLIYLELRKKKSEGTH